MKHVGYYFNFVKNNNYNMTIVGGLYKMINKHKICLTLMCFHGFFFKKLFGNLFFDSFKVIKPMVLQMVNTL